MAARCGTEITDETMMRLFHHLEGRGLDYYETIARNTRIARNITRNVARRTGIYLECKQYYLVRLLVILARLLVMLSVMLQPIFTDFSDFLGR